MDTLAARRALASAPSPWPLCSDSYFTDASCETQSGKSQLLQLRKKALTEEAFVEASLLKAPKTFHQLLVLILGKAPPSIFRLVNVDSGWAQALPDLVKTPKEFQVLVEVFRTMRAVYKTKVMFCMRKLWETSQFEQFLSARMEATLAPEKKVVAVMDLYCLAVMLSFEVPNMPDYVADIFPYGETYRHHVRRAFGEQVEQCVTSIICSYYIRIIHNICMMNKLSNMHTLKPLLAKCNAAHQVQVASFARGLPALLDTVLFPLIGKARSEMCALGVFCTVQLLVSKNPTLESFIKGFNCIPLVLRTAQTRFRHTRWACNHLMKLLLGMPWLVEYTMPFLLHWADMGCAPGHFDTSDVRFRFALSFVQAVLREGLEVGDPAQKGSSWQSCIRNSHVLHVLVEALSDHSCFPRQMRALRLLEVLTDPACTTAKDLTRLSRMVRWENMPRIRKKGTAVQSVKQYARLSKSSALAKRRKQLAKSSGSFKSLNHKSSKGSIGRSGSKSGKSGKGSRLLSRSSSASAELKYQKQQQQQQLLLQEQQQQQQQLLQSKKKGGVGEESVVCPGSAFSELPVSLVLRVLSFLPAQSIFYLATTCSSFNELVDDPRNGVWEDVFMRMNTENMMSVPQRSSKEKLSGLWWKVKVKERLQNALPNALYQVIVARILNRSGSSEEMEVRRREALASAFKAFRIVMRSPLWWPSIDRHVELQWWTVLLSSAHDGSSLELNRSVWKVWYQMLVYNTGLIERCVKSGFLQRFLQPLSMEASPVVLFNGLYYLAKMLANDPISQEGRKRMARKDVQLLARFIKRSDLWKQFHALYLAAKADPEKHTVIFPILSSLFAAVHDSYLCKQLRAHIFKNAEHKAALLEVRSLYKVQAKKSRAKDDAFPAPASSSPAMFDPHNKLDQGSSPSLAMKKKRHSTPASTSSNAAAEEGAASHGEQRRGRRVTISGIKSMLQHGHFGPVDWSAADADAMPHTKSSSAALIENDGGEAVFADTAPRSATVSSSDSSDSSIDDEEG